jgi:NAD(P)-dependent dehydrogenase (short-subunit alcohol dehydrogenase family)
VSKTAVVGLTKYLAAYWAEDGVRVNSLSPGGIQKDQPIEFVNKIEKLIPMKRMAFHDEYHGAVVFLCSDASSYMTGQNIVIDGGRSVI